MIRFSDENFVFLNGYAITKMKDMLDGGVGEEDHMAPCTF